MFVSEAFIVSALLFGSLVHGVTHSTACGCPVVHFLKRSWALSGSIGLFLRQVTLSSGLDTVLVTLGSLSFRLNVMFILSVSINKPLGPQGWSGFCPGRRLATSMLSSNREPKTASRSSKVFYFIPCYFCDFQRANLTVLLLHVFPGS